MMYLKTPAEIALAAKFMTTQDDGNILAERPSNSFLTQFVLGSASIQNRSGSAAIVGIGGRLPIGMWEAGQWDDSDYAAGTVFTDDTTDAQDAGTGDFVMDVVGTNNDGFAIASAVPFNIVSVIVSQASSASTAWSASYSKATEGTGFSSNYTTLSNMLVAPSFGSTGEQLLWFNCPQDWVKTSSTTTVANRHGAGIPDDKYVLVIKSTTAPNSTAGLATLLVLGRMYYPTEAVADNATFLRTEDEGEFPILPQCDALCAAISDISTLGSRATATYRVKG